MASRALKVVVRDGQGAALRSREAVVRDSRTATRRLREAVAPTFVTALCLFGGLTSPPLLGSALAQSSSSTVSESKSVDGPAVNSGLSPQGGAQAGSEDEWAEFDDLETASATAAVCATEGTESNGWSLHGFVESTIASRVVADDRALSDFVAAEARGRLQFDAAETIAKARISTDFVQDAVLETFDVDFRNAWVDVAFGDKVSLRVGRQILTWGTGDLIFINDLFPKDFRSFFIGRDDEFLKAPSTAIKASLFRAGINLDIVWTPIFEPDRFIDGRRLSFFFFPAGTTVGPSTDVTPLSVDRPDRTIDRGELSMRLSTTVAGWELAAYNYLGFFKQPLGLSRETGRLRHPRLGVFGTSARGLVGGGVTSFELGYYHSFDDVEGEDPFVPNGSLRTLIGYERAVAPGMTISAQGYFEYTLAHDRLIRNSPRPAFEPDELRFVATVRFTYLALADNLNVSMFAFFSPTDVDGYLRPAVRYKLTESLSVAAGGNIIVGKDRFTFFGQLRKNTNAYLRMRYAF